ncbi:rhomboid family intramembrane serine protease [Sciscionella marina]|uniref:rhomboid family intramembrane serine protease n=1 Tax=Sciscionella marina TaxID=508770 RepID=UPI0003746D7B
MRTPTTVAGAPIRRGPPVVTFVLIAVNVLMYVITAYQSQSVMQNTRTPLFVQLDLFPAYVAAHGEWWRLLTSGFLHFGLLHIVLNMVSLYIIGREVEVVLGRIRFTALYFTALLGGGVAAFLLSPVDTQVAGASGAVFGLMGALLVAVVRLKLDPKSVLFVIVLNLVISFQVTGISWQGHVGGLIIGALTMAAMVYAPAKRRTVVQIGTIIVILAVLVLICVLRTSALSEVTICNQAQWLCTTGS